MQRSRNSGGKMSVFEEKMEVSRRLLDKDSFQQCIKMLHEFLVGLGFPGTISVKSLHTTAHREFLKIYGFFRCFTESFFHFPANGLEGEIPKLLKDLRYPVALCSNSRYCHKAVLMSPRSVGAIWFVWLNEWLQNWIMIKMMGELKEKESSSPCDVEEGAEFNEPLWEHCRDTYRKFLEGADTIEKEDEALLNLLLNLFTLDKKHFYSEYEKHRFIMEHVEIKEREYQDRLKREGSPVQHFLEMSNVFTAVIQERKRSLQKDRSLTLYMDIILQRLRNNSDSDMELGGNGAAGVERGGAKTRTSRRGKKVRRRRRK